MRQWRAWADEGMAIPIAVNLSPRSLLDRQLPGRGRPPCLERFDDAAVVPAHRADRELPDGGLGPVERRARRARPRSGISLSIDDFGTGYSSLSHLKRLPIDEIKIDRSFVMDMHDDGDDFMIVRATVDLGKNLGLRVVAEGVEDRETFDRLADFGCDEAQGYYISRPMPLEEFGRWLSVRTPEAIVHEGAVARTDVQAPGRGPPARSDLTRSSQRRPLDCPPEARRAAARPVRGVRPTDVRGGRVGLARHARRAGRGPSRSSGSCSSAPGRSWPGPRPGEDFVVAGLATALDAPVLAVAPGTARGRGARGRPRGVPRGRAGRAAAGVGGAAVRGHLAGARDRGTPGAGGRGRPEAKGAFVLVAPGARGDAGARSRPSARRLRCSSWPGSSCRPTTLAERLVELGYSRADVVEHRGEFAVRGGVVDVFPGTARRPVRLDYWGDEVESIREFVPSTQLSTDGWRSPRCRRRAS